MNRNVIWAIGGFAVGFLTGGYLAYRNLSKVYKRKLEEAAAEYEDEEVEDVDWDDPFDVVGVNEVEETRDEKNEEIDYVKLSRVYSNEDFNKHFEQRVGPKDDDSEYDPDDIYIIDQERFKKEIAYRDNETITYYQQDDTLVDSCENVLRNRERVIGIEAMDEIGTTDADFIYVSNDVENKAYEIVIEHTYSWRDMVSG